LLFYFAIFATIYNTKVNDEKELEELKIL